MENKIDEKMWKKAKERVSFKKHLTTYVLVNIFIWIIWYLTTNGRLHIFAWPIFTTLGWGIGILAHYFKAYVNDEEEAIQKEYDKLKNKKG